MASRSRSVANMHWREPGLIDNLEGVDLPQAD